MRRRIISVKMAGIFSSQLSALRPEEVIVCAKKQIVTVKTIFEVLNYYYSGITQPEDHTIFENWVGRPRIFFDGLLARLIEYSRHARSVEALRKIMLRCEPGWYQSMVLQLRDYIAIFAERVNPLTSANGVFPSRRDTLQKICREHDVSPRDREQWVVTMEEVCALVDSNLVFCEFGDGCVKTGQMEPAFFHALKLYLDKTAAEDNVRAS